MFLYYNVVHQLYIEIGIAINDRPHKVFVQNFGVVMVQLQAATGSCRRQREGRLVRLWNGVVSRQLTHLARVGKTPH